MYNWWFCHKYVSLRNLKTISTFDLDLHPGTYNLILWDCWNYSLILSAILKFLNKKNSKIKLKVITGEYINLVMFVLLSKNCNRDSIFKILTIQINDYLHNISISIIWSMISTNTFMLCIATVANLNPWCHLWRSASYIESQKDLIHSTLLRLFFVSSFTFAYTSMHLHFFIIIIKKFWVSR